MVYNMANIGNCNNLANKRRYEGCGDYHIAKKSRINKSRNRDSFSIIDFFRQNLLREN